MTNPASTQEVSSGLLAKLRQKWPDARYAEAPSRVFGGNQSFVYALALDGAGSLRGPLILRILRPFLPSESVAREAAVQAALHDAGYPVARVGYHCVDPAVLGGAFQLMERLPGAPMLAAGANTEGTIGLGDALADFRVFVFGPWPERVAQLQRELHGLAIDALVASCKQAGLAERDISFEASLERLEQRARSEELPGLLPVFDWLRDSDAFVGRPRVLCHGDFFPNQVMESDGEVSGVIDWSDVCLAPIEFDVVTVQVGIETLPVPFGGFGRAIVRRRARHFSEAYTAHTRLDEKAARYAEAVRCMHSLLGVAERRRALSRTPNAPKNPNPYDDPSTVMELQQRVHRITGINPTLSVDASAAGSL